MYNLDIDGYMEENELKVIEELAKTVPAGGVIVEMGSFKGRSSYTWAKSCKPDVTVYCVDIFHVHNQPHDSFYQEFLDNTKDCDNIKTIKGTCPYEVEYNGPPIDLFFLDAMHSNPHDIDAINHFLPFMKSGGIFCGHDYIDSPDYDIVANVTELEQRLNQKVELFPGTSIWVLRIP